MKIKRKFHKNFVNRNIGKKAYTNHKTTIKDLLGKDKAYADSIFNNDELTKGHIAPAGAFSFRFQKSITYNLKNAAPQWKKLNGGVWTKLENNLRDYVIRSNRDIGVIVGNAVSCLVS